MATLPLTLESLVEHVREGIETYRMLRDHDELSHKDALDQTLSEVEEGVMCALGKCGH